MTAQEAIDIAKREIDGKIEYPDDTVIDVKRSGDTLIVTFKCQLPANVRGPDYYARVTVSCLTRKVVGIQVAS